MDIFKLYKILNENAAVDIFANEEMVDEMAMIVGDLDNAIRDVVEANPNLDGLELKRKIRNNDAVVSALAGDKLHDNQLNRFITKIKSGAPRTAPSSEPSAPRVPSAASAAGEEPAMTKSVAVSPARKMSIIAKLDAGAEPEELAKRYGLEVDDIMNIQARSKAEDEGDVKDISGLRQGDDDFKTIELEVPEQSDRSVKGEILTKAERMFYIAPKTSEKDVMASLKNWAAKRNDKTDITKTQHPLRGASDDQVDSALNSIKDQLAKARKNAESRKKQQFGAEVGDEEGGRADKAKDLEKEFQAEESFEQFSKTLSEHMKTLKSTSIMRYPNQITFSEEFLNRFAEEYLNHTTVNEDRGIIRNLEEKMIKALRMHLHEMAKKKKEAMMNEKEKMIKCPKCGHMNPPGTKKCQNCGHTL
jgi:ribosomal protein L40E